MRKPQQIKSIWDNEGATYDCITIVFKEIYRSNLYIALGCSIEGTGFFQHTTAIEGIHLGRKISFQQLNINLQQRLINYFKK